MSCQKVLSMLSAYIDGEVQTSDAEMIKNHLSECDSCAAEWKALQAMTGILRTTPEVEPPAFLLAQIEAATVNRTGFLTKVRNAFGQAPVMVRWAAAPVAAAIVLCGMLFSNNSGNVQTPVAVKSPTERIEKAIPSAPALPNVTVEERSPSAGTVVAARPATRTRSYSRVAHVSGRVKSTGAKTEHSKEVKAPKTSRPTVAEEPKLEDPIVEEPMIASDTPEKSEADLVSTTGGTDEPVVVAKTSDVTPVKKTVILDDQPSSMDQLRKKLAAKNRAKFNGQEDRIEGKKYSVGLISLRF